VRIRTRLVDCSGISFYDYRWVPEVGVFQTCVLKLKRMLLCEAIHSFALRRWTGKKLKLIECFCPAIAALGSLPSQI
jgi:hypothetical protein